MCRDLQHRNHPLVSFSSMPSQSSEPISRAARFRLPRLKIARPLPLLTPPDSQGGPQLHKKTPFAFTALGSLLRESLETCCWSDKPNQLTRAAAENQVL